MNKNIEIPKNYSHKIENINNDFYYKNINSVILSCYFTTKKDPIHHSTLENESRKTDEYSYMKPLYESCLKLNLHLIIFHDDLSDEYVKKYTTKKILFRKTKLISNLTINDERFIIYYEYLLKNPYKYVLSCDISDVFIKKDPFELFENFYTRDNIDQSLVDMILKSKNIKDNFKYSPFYPNFQKENDLTITEIKRYLNGLKKIDKNNYLLDEMIFIGTNSIDDGPDIKTNIWFERRKDKVNSLNETIINYLPNYKEYKSHSYQMYNIGTLMANYNTYLKFINKFIKILFECCKTREKNNWNMLIANYICHNYFIKKYNKDTYHTRYIYTGYPFNSIYQRYEDINYSDCYLIHK